MPDWRPLVVRRKDGYPIIMGVINITPDSFFEDSRSNDISEIIKIAQSMIHEYDWHACSRRRTKSLQNIQEPALMIDPVFKQSKS